MTKNQIIELEVNEKAKVALENVIEMNIPEDDYFENSFEGLEMMGGKRRNL